MFLSKLPVLFSLFNGTNKGIKLKMALVLKFSIAIMSVCSGMLAVHPAYWHTSICCKAFLILSLSKGHYLACFANWHTLTYTLGNNKLSHDDRSYFRAQGNFLNTLHSSRRSSMEYSGSVLILVNTWCLLVHRSSAIGVRQDTFEANLSRPLNLKIPSSGSCASNGSASCSPWSQCDIDTHQCQCPLEEYPVNGFKRIFKCDKQGYIDAVQKCSCLTYSETSGLVEIGFCVYNCIYFNVPGSDVLTTYSNVSLDPRNWTSDLCGRYHRTGPLCGDCITGHYLQAYSLDVSCKPCSDSWSNWVKYLLVAYVPLTVFCFIILLFRINITASRLQGYVFFSQFVTIYWMACYIKLLNGRYSGNSSLSPIADILLMVHGIWNLDFFRSFDLGICLQVDMLTSISLDLAIAIYPLVLMILTYLVIHLYYIRFRPVVCMWRPFRSVFHFLKANSSWEAKASVIDAFATVFVLSNIKFQSVSLTLLAPIKVYYITPSGNVSYHWNVYASSGIRYLSQGHLPFFVLALCILVFFIAVPFLFILLYPFRICQCCLNLLSYRWQIILRSFVDTFQGCYKNGTESGSWDCRWFAVLPHLSQVVGFIVLSVFPFRESFCAYSIILVMSSIAIIIIEPHKTNLTHLSSSLTVNILFLACCSVSIWGIMFYGYREFYAATVAFGSFPMFYYYIGLILQIRDKLSKK